MQLYATSISRSIVKRVRVYIIAHARYCPLPVISRTPKSAIRLSTPRWVTFAIVGTIVADTTGRDNAFVPSVDAPAEGGTSFRKPLSSVADLASRTSRIDRSRYGDAGDLVRIVVDEPHRCGLGGSHGRTGLAHALLGSIASQVHRDRRVPTLATAPSDPGSERP